jgi:hypothetical protein
MISKQQGIASHTERSNRKEGISFESHLPRAHENLEIEKGRSGSCVDASSSSSSLEDSAGAGEGDGACRGEEPRDR